jgi:hypothetical protein
MHRTRLTPQQQAHMLQQQQQPQYFADGSDEDGSITARAPQAQTQAAMQQPRTARQQPRYAQPTSSTVLPEYANSEADVIRASFTTGNCQAYKAKPVRAARD